MFPLHFDIFQIEILLEEILLRKLIEGNYF